MADDTVTHVHMLRVRDHRIRCADPVMVAGGFGHDAEGPVYEALEDTAYSPDAYPKHWRR